MVGALDFAAGVLSKNGMYRVVVHGIIGFGSFDSEQSVDLSVSGVRAANGEIFIVAPSHI